MVSCSEFKRICLDHDFQFFTGVPDSTFKSWLTHVNDNDDDDLTHVRTVNECEATAVGAGYHLATGDVPVVYMQNDGLGKCVNPLTSLCNEEVYNIPLLLMIGWRAKPGTDDAVQHHKMGEILKPLLDLLDIPHEVLPETAEGIREVIASAREYVTEYESPYAVIVEQETFEGDSISGDESDGFTRERAVIETVDAFGDAVFVGTTGKLSRELYEYRKRTDESYQRDFYNVGAMGCAQSIGLGLSMNYPEDVVVLDGDGSLLMQFGAMATAGKYAPEDFYHVVFDNEAYDSTGGQPSSSDVVSFDEAASACGYELTCTVDEASEIGPAVERLRDADGPGLLVVNVVNGERDDLGRPEHSPVHYKNQFMRWLQADR